ncbi:MAG: FeoA family protein [Kistimonas sp.]|nr:FeoA family protein [Kistimonas sp.]
MLAQTRETPATEDMTLGDLQVNDSCQINSYTVKGDYRRQLMAMGLMPGVQLRVVRKAPMGDPMQLELGGVSLIVRRDEARYIRVQKSGHGKKAGIMNRAST